MQSVGNRYGLQVFRACAMILALWWCLSLVACSPGSGTKKCSANTDCESGQLCLGGRCLSPNKTEKSAEGGGDTGFDAGGLPEEEPLDLGPLPDLGGDETATDSGTPDNGSEPTGNDVQDAGPQDTPVADQQADTTPDTADPDTQDGGNASDGEAAGENDPAEAGDQGAIDITGCQDGQTRACYTGPQGTDGKGICKAGKQICRNGFWDLFCDGEIKPAQEDCNGKDDDCDGSVDNNTSGEGDACTDTTKKGPCAQGKQVCKNGALVCESSVQPTQEVCGNGKDEDCDGRPDGPPCVCSNGEERDCYNGPTGTGGVGECVKGKQQCDNSGNWGPCLGELLPGLETCNGKDDNCDGQTDETFPEKGKPCTDTTKQGECQSGAYDRCDQGKLVCVSNVQPKPTEVCGNGKDDDCNGKIDENPPCQCIPTQQRSCYTGPTDTDGKGECKRGVQTCDSSGQWGTCTGEVLPKDDACDGKDNDCDGRVDNQKGSTRELQRDCFSGTSGCTKQSDGTYKCNGICRQGIQYCRSAQWTTACYNQIIPRTEYCNGQDDDCDGTVDENASSVGNTCYVSGVQGECRVSKYTCEAGKLVCKQTVQPKPEECNRKDDDCDGYIDNAKGSTASYSMTRPCTGSSGCTQDAQGNITCKGTCKAGTQRCGGSWGSCSGYTGPRLEICRDNLDNDCDGTVDDICGPQHTYAYVDYNYTGYFRARRNFSSITNTSTGNWQLKTSSTRYGCSSTPLFLTVRNSSVRTISYSCSTYDFVVHTGFVSGSPYNSVRFYAVAPVPGAGEAYGLVTLSGTTPYLSRSYGSPRVTRTGVGAFSITHTNCASSTQPVLATIYDTKVSGHVTAYASRGTCYIRTFGLDYKPADRRFSFWIPNSKTNAIGFISKAGTVSFGNTFGDAYAKWSASLSSGTSGYISTRVGFSGASSSAAGALITTPRGVDTFSSPGYYSSSATIYNFSLNPLQRAATDFFILFVQ